MPLITLQRHDAFCLLVLSLLPLSYTAIEYMKDVPYISRFPLGRRGAWRKTKKTWSVGDMLGSVDACMLLGYPKGGWEQG
ncbi:hypothetical protein J3F84DRAFT_374808 [Trichoderma pleuroticola]